MTDSEISGEPGSMRIGTSGWIYKHWKAIFYPKGLSQRQWFDFYAERFDTVEINFTFYRLPERRVFKTWNQRAPEDFLFAVKGSQYVTHMKRLVDPEEHVGLFFRRASALQQHLGPVLWQLPPSFKRNDERLQRFLKALPDDYRHTIEFRHESWFADEVLGMLREQGVALCIPDSPKRPGEIRLTVDWTYLRFHQGHDNGRYTDSQLDDWCARINDLRKRGIDVWAYFNNDPHGYAIENALALRERLSP